MLSIGSMVVNFQHLADVSDVGYFKVVHSSSRYGHVTHKLTAAWLSGQFGSLLAAAEAFLTFKHQQLGHAKKVFMPQLECELWCCQANEKNVWRQRWWLTNSFWTHGRWKSLLRIPPSAADRTDVVTLRILFTYLAAFITCRQHIK